MPRKWFTGIFSIVMILFSMVVINVTAAYAQEPTAEGTVTAQFAVPAAADTLSAASTNPTDCQLTAELRWYRNQRVRVLYHWQSCNEPHTVDWELASVRTASGTFALSDQAGTQAVYDERWDELQADQLITLHTQIDGVVQPTVTTRYQDTNPVWPQIHTRHDNGGACFQFTGHNDPWGVFTAGDQRYTFLLADRDWETPWLVAPNEALIDWHIAFYRDEGLTRLRAEYDFRHVPNPCHRPPPARCNQVVLTIANGIPIPTMGAEVSVTVVGENGTEYRIVDEAGNVVVGPTAEQSLSLHALPNVTYQAQVYGAQVDGEGYDWTNEGCTFRYGEQQARCTGVDLSMPSGTAIAEEGATISAIVHGENSTEFRIVDILGAEVAGPSTNNLFEFQAQPITGGYQAQVRNGAGEWSTENCRFHYVPVENSGCAAVILNPPTSKPLARDGEPVAVTVIGINATEYRLVYKATGEVVAGPSTNPQFQLHTLPDLDYEAQTRNQQSAWVGGDACGFSYRTPPPACVSVNPSIPNGSVIPTEGTTIAVDVVGRDATQYRLMTNRGQEIAPAQPESHFSLQLRPGITYTVEVADARNQWTTSANCQLYYASNPEVTTCEGVVLSVADHSPIPIDGIMVDVQIIGKNSTRYRIMGEGNHEIVATEHGTLRFHALPNLLYVAQVAGDTSDWTSSSACQFQYASGLEQIAQCSLDPDHYGDPGGISRITAWIKGDEQKLVPITAVTVNWDNHGTVNYPTQEQAGPWVTTQRFELRSRPEVWDIGFGRYRFEAWVYLQGISQPAYCWGVGDAPDHDNVVPDPGPFAKDNPEGKFNRGSAPSRLPTVGRLPFDGGNGPDKIELILWAFEKEGHGITARITAIANEGEPLARLGMASVSDMVKFDGLNAREGIVYGFQIGEHGPWSPLFCSPPDSNPTTITVYWGAGGMTWLSDGAAYGDCWWLTVAAALKGWVTVDETVATYNALQPVINWHGHQNLVFSLAQNRETGLGPRMQDAVIGLQAATWHGPLIPESTPADFQQVVENYQQAR